MRKVTASAVILTAITGCSQSEAPSAQWSFDPPATEATTFTDRIQQGRLNDPTLSALSPAAQTPAAQKFLDQKTPSGQGEIMGPAFEQPIGQLGEEQSKEQTETLIGNAQPTPQDVVVPIQTQRRTDPIAEVRAYLNRARSNSFLGDRVPYSAQVELPSAPNYTTSIYSQQAATFAEATPAPITEQASLEQASISAVPTLDAAAQTVASLSRPQAQFSTSDLLAAVQTPTAATPAAELSSSTLSSQLTSYGVNDSGSDAASDVALDQSETAHPITVQPVESTLPVLRAEGATPAENMSAVALAEAEDQVAEEGRQNYVRDENVSIGTAILNDLRSNQAAERSGSDHVENSNAVALVSDEATTAEQAVTEQAVTEQVVTEQVITEQIGQTAHQVPEQIVESANAEQPLFESTSISRASVSAIEPMVVSDQISTDTKLARLLQTLPQRSLADQAETPLISHFQASTDFQTSPNFQLPHEELQQALVDSSIETETDASTPAPSLSLLLEGLRETANPTSALPTLYMPIPEAPLASASATLIQTAIEALGSNANTAALVNELTTENASSTIEMLIPSGSSSNHPEARRLVQVDGTAQPNNLQKTNVQQKRSQQKLSEAAKALRTDRLSGSTDAQKLEETLSSRPEARHYTARYRQRIVWR